MLIVLNNSDLEKAIESYVNQIGFSTTGKELEISIKHGRSGNGSSAEVVIDDTETVQEDLTPEEAVNTEAIF